VLFVVDPESDSLTPLFRSDDRVLRGDLRISIGRRLSGSVAALGQTTISGDAHLDQDEVGALTHPLRSALIAPVIREGRPVAVLSLYADAPDAFNETHRRVVDAAARCIAVIPMQPSSADVAAATAA
jgi:GAF domain-containing protein